jgi:hypothetical protein
MLYPSYAKREYEPSVNEKIGRIIKIEWEITQAIRSGHKSHWGDEFKDKRNEAESLRKL